MPLPFVESLPNMSYPLPVYSLQSKVKPELLRRGAMPWLLLLALLSGTAQSQTPSTQATVPLATSPVAVEDGASAAEEATTPVSGAHPKAEMVTIAVPHEGLFGSDINMVAQLYKPAGPGPFPVLIYSHGRAGNPAVRGRLKSPISGVQINYWLEKNFAVVAPIRVGYGATGGADFESNGGGAGCRPRPDFTRPAGGASAGILATLAWVRKQPWADAQRMILEGQSVGGLGTVAAGATRPDGVLGYINFGGGAGGDPDRSPGHSCDPEQLTDLYSGFGKQTVMPNLWVYALNDQYWGRDMPVAWHDAFAAGGSPTEFIHAAAVPDGDGHGLNHHARELWAPYVDAFLHARGF